MTAPVDWPCPRALPAQAAALAAAAAAVVAAVVAADVVVAAVLVADAVRGPWETAWQVRQHALGWHAGAGSSSVGVPGQQPQLVTPPTSVAVAAAAAAAAAAAVGAVHAAVSAGATGAAGQAVHGAAGSGPGMGTCLTYADYLVGGGWGLDPMMDCEHVCSCPASHEHEGIAL